MNTKTIPIGIGAILVTKTDFLNGYQAGHLSYIAAKTSHPQPYTDEEVTEMILERLEDMTLSSSYGIGFAVGWFNTLARKGTNSQSREKPAATERE